MKKTTRIWLITASALVLFGTILFVIAMTLNHWDFSSLGTVRYETRTMEIRGDFQNISLRCDTEDIFFVPSADGTCKVVVVEQEKVTHTAAAQDGTLLIETDDQREWYDHLVFFTVGTPSVTVHLPELEYESLSIQDTTGDISIPKDFSFESIDLHLTTGNVTCQASSFGPIRITADTGDIRLEDLSAGWMALSVSTGKVTASSIVCEGDLELTVSTGDAELQDLTCLNLTSAGNTGDLTLQNVIAEGLMTLRRTTGDIDLDRCDAAELTIETDTGKVKGTLLSPKIFIVKSDTGRIEVPESTEGGSCRITTVTGDIQIKLP